MTIETPPEIPPELGQLIDTIFGTLDTHTAIPPEGAPTPLNVLHPGQAWSDDVKWIQDRYDSIVDAFGGSFDISPEATRLKAHALAQAQMEATSGHINLQADYTKTVAAQLAGYLHLQTMYVQRVNAVLAYKVDALTFAVANVPSQIAYQTEQALIRAGAYTDAVGQFVATAMQGWGLDHIFKPLVDELGAVATQLRAETDVKVVTGTGVAIDAAQKALLPVAELAITTAGELAPVAAAVPILENAVGKLTQEATDCVEPMCQQFGPKSDFSKLWNALKALLGLGLGAAALGLTEPQLENMAHAFAALTSGSLESFLHQFVEGGGTLGGAGGAVVGELTGVARTVLGDLGVPVP